MTAPASSVECAHPPMPPTSRTVAAGDRRRQMRADRACVSRSRPEPSSRPAAARRPALQRRPAARRRCRLPTACCSISSLRSERLHAALVQDEHVVDAGQRARAVRDDDRDAAARAHTADRTGQRLARRRVEVRVRLVEHDQERVAVEGAGQRDALALAAGQRGAAVADLGVVAVAAAAGSCRARRPRSRPRSRLRRSGSGSKRAMFSATVPSNSSTSCGR